MRAEQSSKVFIVLDDHWAPHAPPELIPPRTHGVKRLAVGGEYLPHDVGWAVAGRPGELDLSPR